MNTRDLVILHDLLVQFQAHVTTFKLGKVSEMESLKETIQLVEKTKESGNHNTEKTTTISL